MRELRGADIVTVRHIPGETNPADIFTKILSRAIFERHRKTILNLTKEPLVEGGVSDDKRVKGEGKKVLKAHTS